MAVQFLNSPNQNQWGGLAEGLGSLLGGLGGVGLGYGAQKLGFGGQEDEQVQQLIKSGMMTPEQAQIYKKMKTPQERSSFLQNVMKQAEGSRQAELLSRAIGGGAGQQMTPQMGMQQPGMGMGQMPMMAPEQQVMPQQQGIQALGGLGAPENKLEQLEQRREAIAQSGANPQLVKDAIASIDRQIDTLIKKESMARKEKMEEKKLKFAEQREIDKETKPFYDKLQGESKEAKKSAMRLDRMEQLVKKGDLAGPLTSSLLNTVSKGIFGFGIDLGGLTSADSQEFKKISTDFLKGAKQVFGSRITQREVEMFLDTIPSLNQSDEGKIRVINNLRIFNDAANVEKEAMDQVIAENGGRRPRNLEQQVEKKSKYILDSLAEQFKNGVRGKTPEEKIQKAEKLNPQDILGTKTLMPFTDWRSNLTL